VWFQRPEIGFAIPLYEPLRDLVGGALARELCLSTRRIELEEAHRIGLVTQIAEPDGALQAALKFADGIAARPPDAVRMLKAKFVAAAGIAARPTLGL
jgi:enoyl-CoA hydratase/carnithine racemase